ncbi:MAG: hypothetical protein ABIG44_12005 [Planctomycetota bacterium]
MRKEFAGILTIAILLATTPIAGALDEQHKQQQQSLSPTASKTVLVTAEGYNQDDALKQALRRALEQGAGVQIASYSQTQDFVLVRDTIYSRAAGIISDYRVIEAQPTAGGAYRLTIEAVVRPDTVAATWGEVRNLLDQIGRPKIMVWIDERIDGHPQPDSIVESRIEQMFIKIGFDLVTHQALGAPSPPEATDIRDRRNLSRLQQMARQAGAHILIRGTANADRAGLENIHGQIPAAFYNCDVQARIYYTDTGQLLASESVPSTRRGVRARNEFSPQAAREALVEATFPLDNNAPRPPALATKLYEAVMEQWSMQISAGGNIELLASPLNFEAYLKLKQDLHELEGIHTVDGDFNTDCAQLRIRTALSAATLAERLTKPPFATRLEVTELKLNCIRVRVLKP